MYRVMEFLALDKHPVMELHNDRVEANHKTSPLWKLKSHPIGHIQPISQLHGQNIYRKAPSTIEAPPSISVKPKKVNIDIEENLLWSM